MSEPTLEQQLEIIDRSDANPEAKEAMKAVVRAGYEQLAKQKPEEKAEERHVCFYCQQSTTKLGDNTFIKFRGKWHHKCCRNMTIKVERYREEAQRLKLSNKKQSIDDRKAEHQKILDKINQQEVS